MAARVTNNRMMGTQNYLRNIDWQTVLISAGVVFLAPYVLRRIRPLFTQATDAIGANDMMGRVADTVKDTARTVADQVGIDGSTLGLGNADSKAADQIMRH